MPETLKTILTVVGVLVYFASGILLGIVADAMASGKGYKGLPHMITCILFNILGFIGACALPDKKNNEKIVEQLKKMNALLGGMEDEDAPVKAEAKRPQPVYEEEEEEQPVYHSTAKVAPAPRPQEAPRPTRPAPQQFYQEPTSSTTQSGYFSSRVTESAPATPTFSADATAQVVYKDGMVCCSRCNGKIKLNATSCPTCGAKIVSSSNAGGLGYLKPLN